MTEQMRKNELFPKRPKANPTIYTYEFIDVGTHKGLLGVGYTNPLFLNVINEII